MAAGASGPSAASNPRKFSEKIALQRQRQAEETAAFEEVMMDIGSTRLQVQKLRMAHMRGPYYGGSLPNVNQIGSGSVEFQGPPHSSLDPSRGTRHHGLVERVHRDPRRMMSPLRRYMRQVDSSPYSSSYLSPQQEPSWRRNIPWGNFPSEKGQLFRLPSALNRTNSDSALHTSVMNPSSQDGYPGSLQDVPPPSRRSAFPFPAPAMEENLLPDSKYSLKPCDAKKLPAASPRPKSCEVPGINIYPSADLPVSVPLSPSILNTGGSLPDLTNLHFPSPLPTPLDPDESYYNNLSGGSSTGNLTHLGIRKFGLPPAYDVSGLSPMLNSLSRPSLLSSLSHPNLQTSLSSTSLQTSFSNPSLPSSLSNQSLSPSAYSSPSSSPSSSFPPPTSMNTSPLRRVPLSPLTLPLGGDSRRQHQKQFSPTMSPTLTSITQGVPLDTSKLPGDQRLPPYHFNHPSLLHQSQQPLHQSQQPLHQSQQPLHQPMHQSQQPMHQSQQPLHQSQQPLHQDSQQPLHQHQQPLHQSQHRQLMHQDSQQPLHQHRQPMHHDSQQPLHQSQHRQPMHEDSQQPLQQSQHRQPMHEDSQQPLHQSQHRQPMHEDSQQPLHQHPSHQAPPTAQHFPVPCQQNSEGQPYEHLLGDYSLGSSVSLLSTLFDDFDQQLTVQQASALSQQFEQFNMESRTGGLSVLSGAYPGDYDPNSLSLRGGNSLCDIENKQNLSNCGRHDPIPNIILTAVDAPPGFSKEITSALAGVPGFEMGQSLGLEEDLRIEPLTLDGLHMLSDPYALLTDPLVEDSFRSDRLQ